MMKKDVQYLNIIKFLLLFVGLWPYQQSSFTKFQHIFISVLLSAFIIFQLTPFITFKCTLDFVTKNLSSTTFFSMFIIVYNSFCFNIKNVKDLLAQLQHSRNKLMDKNEVAIFKKYDSISGRYTIGLTILGIFGILATVIAQIWLNLSNVDLSANKSRTNYFLFTMEYFIDQQKYYYLIMLHSHVAVYFGTILMVATGTMMIMYIHHTCGMFRVAKYRIEHAVNFNIRRNMIPNSAIFMTQGIICAVDMHRQAIKLNKNFMSVLEKMMFCLIVCAVACLSLNMFQLAFEKDVKKLVMPFTRTLVCVIYMYLANLMGQIVIDHNNQVFDTAYNVDWFKTPVHVQKMILFLLQRRSKEFALNVGGVYDASIQNFATLVKASVSYFTVICST